MTFWNLFFPCHSFFIFTSSSRDTDYQNSLNINRLELHVKLLQFLGEVTWIDNATCNPSLDSYVEVLNWKAGCSLVLGWFNKLGAKVIKIMKNILPQIQRKRQRANIDGYIDIQRDMPEKLNKSFYHFGVCCRAFPWQAPSLTLSEGYLRVEERCISPLLKWVTAMTLRVNNHLNYCPPRRVNINISPQLLVLKKKTLSTDTI